jgi:hypothetical protein
MADEARRGWKRPLVVGKGERRRKKGESEICGGDLVEAAR